MTSALLLLTYAMAASLAGPWLLKDAKWPTRAPRLGILAWQSLSTSVVTAVALAASALTLGLTHVSADVASLADLCATTLQHLYETPAGAVGSFVGAFAFVAGLARLVYVCVRLATTRRREKVRFLRVLDLVAHRDGATGALVIDHSAPYAFCLSGLAPRVVVTSALVAQLSDPQLAAVLAHESAHLRQHHHLVQFVSRVLSSAFGAVAPWLHTAQQQMAYLIELTADDAAARAVGDQPLREALTCLTEAPVRVAAALAASAMSVDDRVVRLQSGARRLSPLTTALVTTGLVAVVLVPIALVAIPALPSAWHDLCLVAEQR